MADLTIPIVIPEAAQQRVRAVIEKDLLGEQPLPLRNGARRSAESAPG